MGGNVCTRNVRNALAAVKVLAAEQGRRAEDLPVVVDAGGTSLNYAVGWSPCLTAARGQTSSFWLLQAGRFMTVSELCRLQGFSDDDIGTMTFPVAESLKIWCSSILTYVVGLGFGLTCVIWCISVEILHEKTGVDGIHFPPGDSTAV